MTVNGATNQRYLLHVDDDPDDRELVRDVFLLVAPRLVIHSAANGKEAIDYLHSPGVADNPPQLILLDLNMPVMTGLEMLKVLKANPSTAALPVVVLTTSHSPTDNAACLHYGVELVTKPTSIEQLKAILTRIAHVIQGG